MPESKIDLAVVIKSLLDAKGFEDAQVSLKGLAAAANNTAPATRGLADATGGLASSQKVSNREIKILTAELLRSVGVTQGAGAAGRVASTAFIALGDSAGYANLALAGTGLAVVLLLPKIIEWITHTKEQTEEQKSLAKELRDGLPDLKRYADDLDNMNTELRALYELQKSEENAKQLNTIGALSERNRELATSIRELEGPIVRFTLAEIASGKTGNEI